MATRGFIRGEGDDVPQLVTFQQNCRHGALLATVSGGSECRVGGAGRCRVGWAGRLE